ncbi:hypothetical protein J6590_105314 [Homalodisca vitripennis]|nr:hypothetical protein J6590_014533 [Homalodisca vitripennis]KAG8308621.1 hypothetical protein J6590_105314 [Homalodisca vitripennis]
MMSSAKVAHVAGGRPALHIWVNCRAGRVETRDGRTEIPGWGKRGNKGKIHLPVTEYDWYTGGKYLSQVVHTDCKVAN